MNKREIFKRIIKNRNKSSCKGSMTLQFLFGFVLIWCFVLLFALMTFTLAMSSVTQYITFASARQLFLGHIGKPAQIARAQNKYTEFKSKFGVFFKDEVINIASQINPGLNQDFSSDPNLFYGVWTEFEPKILEIETFFGSADEDSGFFATKIGSYLGREPTQTECQAFDDKRWESLKSRSGDRSPLDLPDSINGNTEVFDNGC